MDLWRHCWLTVDGADGSVGVPLAGLHPCRWQRPVMAASRCCSASPVEEGRSVGGALQGWLKEVKRLLAAEAPVEDGERSAVRRDGAAMLSAENERKWGRSAVGSVRKRGLVSCRLLWGRRKSKGRGSVLLVGKGKEDGERCGGWVEKMKLVGGEGLPPGFCPKKNKMWGL